jgi:hypothetical protein
VGVAAYAPRAHAALLHAWPAAEAALDPERFALLRATVEHLLDGGPPAEPRDDVGRAVVAFAEQFVFYVPDVTDEHRAPLREALDRRELVALVEALWVIDQTTRLRLGQPRLLEGVELPPAAPVDVPVPESLGGAVAEVHAQAMLLERLDWLTTETVRLRAAHYHDCKT